MDRKLEEAMMKAGTQITVRVPSSAVVDRVLVHDEECTLNFPSLQAALSDGSSGQLCSFRGVVIWRRHPLPQAPDFKAARTVGHLAGMEEREVQGLTLSAHLGKRSLCVGIKDENDPSVTTSVYIKSTRTAYPLSLLPGSIVDFHRVVKKTSKSSNTYFSFLPVSSLCIHSGPPTSHSVEPKRPSPVAGNRPPRWEDTQVRYLIDLWLQRDPPDVFVAACHVCQIFRVSLKSVCVQCGSLFQPAGCVAAACVNTHHSALLSKFSFLIEDGTSQAVINIDKCCPPDVACKLLQMSQKQWQLLETTVQHQGEIFLQKFGCRGNTAAADLLSLLCDCAKVKRACWLMLRKPTNFTKPEGEVSSVLESLTASDLVTCNINTGERIVETLCLPYLHLQCLDVREMD